MGIAAEVGLDSAGGRIGRAVGHGEVDLIDFAAGELGAEVLMGEIISSHHEAAAGFLVQPVHDAGAGHAADTAEGSEAVKQGIDHGAVLVAMGGVDHHAAGLVEDGEVIVLVENGEGKILRLGFSGFVGWDFDRDFLATGDFVAGLGGSPVDGGCAFLDESLEPGAGEIRQADAKEAVEALAGLFRRYGEGFGHRRKGAES